MTAPRPVLYSFRRCPYAMRARMGLVAGEQEVELREVVLRDKPEEMLAASPKGTVPVLILPDGEVIDESLDIMRWALKMRDDEELLSTEAEAQLALVQDMDATFKPHLDRYKYPNRYPDEPDVDHKGIGLDWINRNLYERLTRHAHLFGEKTTFADIAIFPFIRQFAHVNRDWFYETVSPETGNWLKHHLESPRFKRIMKKYKQWPGNEPGVIFPDI